MVSSSVSIYEKQLKKHNHQRASIYAYAYVGFQDGIYTAQRQTPNSRPDSYMFMCASVDFRSFSHSHILVGPWLGSEPYFDVRFGNACGTYTPYNSNGECKHICNKEVM